MPSTDIHTIVRCWELSGTSELAAPATDAQVRDAEHRLGRTLPGECVALYRLCNGGYVLDGHIQLFPLDGPERSLVQAADSFRRDGEDIPPEMVVFAGNGLGGFFRLWLPPDGTVQVIEGDGNESLTVAGTSLARFLRGRLRLLSVGGRERRRPRSAGGSRRIYAPLSGHSRARCTSTRRSMWTW